MRWILRFALLSAVALLAACAEPEQDVNDLSAEEIYRQAEADLDAGEARTAGRGFAEIERLFPYSQWAKRALLMSAYSFYEAKDFQEAQSAASRYLDFYPSDAEAPYAQYLIALSYYDQITDVGRDQQNTVEALQALREVVQRYPNTEYARDAELKFDLALDHLAGKEMEIGRYYLKRGHNLAAVNRFKAVVDEYQTTTHTEEALHRLVEAYMALGLIEEARKSAAILAYNFPGSSWYEDTYALIQTDGQANASDEGNLFTRTFRQVILGDWL
ncbi:MAG: outer membrane protein assembly factor BamD [Pseudomonadota bacterium]